jgi:site-specific recombinase XerD
VPLSDETLSALDSYLAAEAVIIGQRLASGPLFRNRSKPSQAIGSEHLGRIITKALEDLGVKQRPKDGVSPHALRHTAATEIIEAGVSRETLQRFLGHVHSQTTDIYTRGAAFDLRAVHEARGR